MSKFEFKSLMVHKSSFDGAISGKIEFQGDNGNISLNLNDETCQKMFLLIADGLIDVAKETAIKLSNEAFSKKVALVEHNAPLPNN